MEYLLGERVPSFLEVAHSFDAAPVRRAVDDRQDVEGLEDAAVDGDRLGQGGGVPVALQGPDQIRRADLAGVDRGDQPQDLTPVAPHLAQVEFPPGEGVQAPVIGAVLGPPSFLVGRSASAGR